MPVNLAVAWTNQNSGLLAALPGWTRENARDIRKGPVTWQFADHRLAVANNWLTVSTQPELIGKNVFSQAPPPPGPDAPINYVSPAFAQAFARSINCRLPTTREWETALGTMQTTAGGIEALRETANLRDASWLAQKNYLISILQGRNTQFWPDAGAFIPPELLGHIRVGREATAAFDGDDGVLYFRPVTQGEGRFPNLIGNVATYVEDGDAIAVIGGSALSAPEIELAKAYRIIPLGFARDGFADVGFRLALDAKSTEPSAIEKLRNLLGAQRYLLSP